MTHITLNNQTYTSSELHLIPNNNSWENAIVDFLTEWFNEKENIIVQTSGSTGTPKYIELPKQSMINSARITNAYFELDETKTALLCLPANYIAGRMMLVRAIVSGFNLLTTSPSKYPFKKMANNIDFVALTPYQLQSSIEMLKSNETNISNIIVGGAPITLQLEQECKTLSANIFETYGMTETCSHIALRKINTENTFKVLEGVNILQDDRDCLIISAPHLSNKEFITNDIIEIIDNHHFRWMGRADYVINSAGVKIFPEQVEHKLEKIIPYRFFVTGMPDQKLGEKVVLLIESNNQTIKLDNIKSVLDKYEAPKNIYYLEEFIYSENAKILRKETLNLV